MLLVPLHRLCEKYMFNFYLQHPTSSREAPSVMVTSNKRPAEAPAALPHFAKRVMHDHRSVVANQTPVVDFGPQPGPSGLGGRRVECKLFGAFS